MLVLCPPVCANTPEVDNSSVTVEMPEASTLGNVIIYSCPAGMAFESGARLTSAICMRDGWYSCALGLNCSSECRAPRTQQPIQHSAHHGHDW